jgi:cell division initiation protein
MAITSADIQNQSFKIERRGYDVDEVDVFLERVASEIDDLNDEIAHLRVQASEASSAARTEVISQPVVEEDTASKEELAEKDAKIAELEARLRERKSDDSAIAQALIVAQRTADEIISKAKAEAEQTRINAEEEGKRILDKANAEKQRVIDHINELSASREQVREQYQDMLKEFIGSATQRLSEIGGEVTAGIELPAELLETPKSEEDSASKATTSAAPSTAPKWEPSSSVATYTTPTVTPVVSAPATPKPSAASKDFSGYGDADDSFTFDDVD